MSIDKIVNKEGSRFTKVVKKGLVYTTAMASLLFSKEGLVIGTTAGLYGCGGSGETIDEVANNFKIRDDAIRKRLGYTTVALTSAPIGYAGIYSDESRELLDVTDSRGSLQYTDKFAEILALGTWDGFTLTKTEWLDVLGNYGNNILAAMDDEINATISKGYGIEFDFTNNKVIFHLDAFSVPDTSTQIDLSAVNMQRLKDEVLLPVLHANNLRNEPNWALGYDAVTGEQVTQDQF